jgi:hypothetical protein
MLVDSIHRASSTAEALQSHVKNRGPAVLTAYPGLALRSAARATLGVAGEITGKAAGALSSLAAQPSVQAAVRTGARVIESIPSAAVGVVVALANLPGAEATVGRPPKGPQSPPPPRLRSPPAPAGLKVALQQKESASGDSGLGVGGILGISTAATLFLALGTAAYAAYIRAQNTQAALDAKPPKVLDGAAPLTEAHLSDTELEEIKVQP